MAKDNIVQKYRDGWGRVGRSSRKSVAEILGNFGKDPMKWVRDVKQEVWDNKPTEAGKAREDTMRKRLRNDVEAYDARVNPYEIASFSAEALADLEHSA